MQIPIVILDGHVFIQFHLVFSLTPICKDPYISKNKNCFDGRVLNIGYIWYKGIWDENLLFPSFHI